MLRKAASVSIQVQTAREGGPTIKSCQVYVPHFTPMGRGGKVGIIQVQNERLKGPSLRPPSTFLF